MGIKKNVTYSTIGASWWGRWTRGGHSGYRTSLNKKPVTKPDPKEETIATSPEKVKKTKESQISKVSKTKTLNWWLTCCRKGLWKRNSRTSNITTFPPLELEDDVGPLMAEQALPGAPEHPSPALVIMDMLGGLIPEVNTTETPVQKRRKTRPHCKEWCQQRWRWSQGEN